VCRTGARYVPVGERNTALSLRLVYKFDIVLFLKCSIQPRGNDLDGIVKCAMCIRLGPTSSPVADKQVPPAPHCVNNLFVVACHDCIVGRNFASMVAISAPID